MGLVDLLIAFAHELAQLSPAAAGGARDRAAGGDGLGRGSSYVLSGPGEAFGAPGLGAALTGDVDGVRTLQAAQTTGMEAAAAALGLGALRPAIGAAGEFESTGLQEIAKGISHLKLF